MNEDRDWPECKTEYAFSGIYLHFKCSCCGEKFNGYKSRLICYKCNQDNEG